MASRGVINKNYGKTDGAVRTLIRSALRKVWRSTCRKSFIESVRFPYVGSGRSKYSLKCDECGLVKAQSAKITMGKRKRSWFEVDHITGCHPFLSFDDLSAYVISLFAPLTGYRILCYDCHKERTKLQQEARGANGKTS